MVETLRLPESCASALVPRPDTGARSKLLQELASLVGKYNMMFGIFDNQRRLNPGYVLEPKGVQLLDRMALVGLSYLAAKPPAARKERGQQKWHDLARFLVTLDAHATHFGVKFLHGASLLAQNGVAVSYWLERLDPAHNYGDQWACFRDWAQSAARRAPFSGPEQSDLLYFDEIERERCRVLARGGRWTLGDDPETPIHTLHQGGGCAGYSSLPNVMIYVCSAAGHRIYAGPSDARNIHHSSFLRGEPVLAAGDCLVENGVLRYLNGQSGHYRPSAENIRLFAQTCSDAWNERTLVAPLPGDKHKLHMVRMRHFARLGLDAPLLDASDPDQQEVCRMLNQSSELRTGPLHYSGASPEAAAQQAREYWAQQPKTLRDLLR